MIIARIRAGEDPVPLPLAARFNGGPTVADLAERYLEEHAAVRIKPSTQRRVRSMLHNHILPALGRMPLEAVERSDIVELHQKLSDRPVTANKCVKVLPHMYRLGEGWGLVPEGFNPCRAVEKFPERSRERFLTDAEFTRLGRVLDETVESAAAPLTAVTAIRLLMLTGCRKNEILALRWSDVDLGAGELHLADSKTGPRTVQLPPTAVELLEALPRRNDSPWVFPGNDRDGRYSGGGLDHAWRTVRVAAGLEDVRMHDLSHSCAAYIFNPPCLLDLFSRHKFRNQIVTGFNHIPVVACRTLTRQPLDSRIARPEAFRRTLPSPAACNLPSRV